MQGLARPVAIFYPPSSFTPPTHQRTHGQPCERCLWLAHNVGHASGQTAAASHHPATSLLQRRAHTAWGNQASQIFKGTPCIDTGLLLHATHADTHACSHAIYPAPQRWHSTASHRCCSCGGRLGSTSASRPPNTPPLPSLSETCTFTGGAQHNLTSGQPKCTACMQVDIN